MRTTTAATTITTTRTAELVSDSSDGALRSQKWRVLFGRCSADIAEVSPRYFVGFQAQFVSICIAWIDSECGLAAKSGKCEVLLAPCRYRENTALEASYLGSAAWLGFIIIRPDQ